MKKIVILLSILMIALCFGACRNMVSRSELVSDVDSVVSPSSPDTTSVISEESSFLESEASVVSNGEAGDSSVNNGTAAGSYKLDDFKTAYTDAGFTVTPDKDEEGRDILSMHSDEFDDDVKYRVVVYDTKEEAEKARDQINDKGEEKASSRGNALIIYEKDYKNHDKYIEPFNNL